MIRFSRLRSDLVVRRVALWLPTLLLVACSSPQGAVGSPEAQIRAWEEELMNADRDFAAATARDGVDGWVGFFAPRGAMISEGVGEIRGIDSIRARMEAALADPATRLTWEPLRAKVSGVGDLGYTVGRWESVRTDSAGQDIQSQGLYVTIWQRQPDGRWKVVMDLGNPTDQED